MPSGRHADFLFFEQSVFLVSVDKRPDSFRRQDELQILSRNDTQPVCEIAHADVEAKALAVLPAHGTDVNSWG